MLELDIPGRAARPRRSTFQRISGVLAVCALSFAPALFAPALGVAQTPAVGQKAPEFTLSTPAGEPVQLASDLHKGKTVLVVLRGYPGYQCPFCTKQVHDFADHAKEFAAKDVNILLVYPGPLPTWTSTRRSFDQAGESSLKRSTGHGSGLQGHQRVRPALGRAP